MLMMRGHDFSKQFNLDQDYYLEHLDFINWYRYFFLVKEVLRARPRQVLEIGSGSGIVRNCLSALVEEYLTLDINPQLDPDILGDVRNHNPDLDRRFSCIIIADVLEHIPFVDVSRTLKNLHRYLIPGGEVLITIPHRRSYFLFISPSYKHHILDVPKGFLSLDSFYRRFIKRKIWIDPDHCWEIGDGKIDRRDVEASFKEVEFTIEMFMKLLCVDFWVLRK
jgi:2-polyprenyl-3-methyl-5-hydroxy-6-metoxy-1,4-benzoquinol methylase